MKAGVLSFVERWPGGSLEEAFGEYLKDKYHGSRSNVDIGASKNRLERGRRSLDDLALVGNFVGEWSGRRGASTDMFVRPAHVDGDCFGLIGKPDQKLVAECGLNM